jgi:two-component system nitrate/nitrite response regulator NarL
MSVAAWAEAVMVQVDIVVIEANNLFRAGLVSLLSSMGLGQIEEAGAISELGHVSGDLPPKIVLAELSNGLPQALETIRQIGTWAPDTRIVFLANDLDIDLLSACYAAGAFGFLLKNISRSALGESLKLVAAGEKIFPSRLASLLSGLASKIGDTHIAEPVFSGYKLSEREIAILRCLVNGQSNKVIAATLDISESTVKVHLKSILRKTGARNRTQAAIWAIDRYRIGPPHAMGGDPVAV